MKKTWGLIIDVARCHDCNNCFLACKDEYVGNHWLPYSKSQPHTGHRWMNIKRREHGQYPIVTVAYLPTPCQHCKNPPCLNAADNKAVTIREDGIVMIDPEKAVGQKQIEASCPYGAIFWNEEYQIPQKCTLCAHLLDNGWEEPRCAQVCPTGAIKAFKMTENQWDKKMAEDDSFTYLPESQTGARIIYKNLDLFTCGFIAGSVALKDSDEVAENAVVTLLDDRGTNLMETQTNNYGDFKLSPVTQGEARFLVDIQMDGLPVKSIPVDFKTSLNIGTVFL